MNPEKPITIIIAEDETPETLLAKLEAAGVPAEKAKAAVEMYRKTLQLDYQARNLVIPLHPMPRIEAIGPFGTVKKPIDAIVKRRKW